MARGVLARPAAARETAEPFRGGLRTAVVFRCNSAPRTKEGGRASDCSSVVEMFVVEMPMNNYDALMDVALDEARRARDAGEVPIGAVVVIDGASVGRGCNHPIGAGDPTAHAEIVAIRDAATRVGNYRLVGATLCVTIEPCLMCVGALVHARVATVVYGAAEPKSGALASTVCGAELPGLNHRFDVIAGVREDACRDLMQTFFAARR